MMKKFHAIAAHNGISIAKTWIFKAPKIDTKLVKIESRDVENEIKHFIVAQKKTSADIERSIKNAQAKLGKSHAEIFEGHLLLLNDPTLNDEVEHLIKNEHISAKNAILNYQKKYVEMFVSLEDKYMQERASDLKSVTNDLLFNLLGLKKADISAINEEVILIAHDLAPAETVYIDTKYVKGIINEIGATTSHVVIIAKSLDIPTVVGLTNATNKFENNQEMILNGTVGEIILNPDTKTKNDIANDLKKQADHKAHLLTLLKKDAITLDGHKVVLEGNIGSVADAKVVVQNSGAGVGLFRSEFLYMSASNWPTEDEQFAAYKETVQQFPNDVVIVRTLDIGGDKNLSYHQFPKELNPFLGHRAIRFCLDNPVILKTQIKAILRASAFGNIAMMIPMVSTIEEIVEVKKILKKCQEELANNGIKFNSGIKLGIMVEIPSTAILAEIFAKYVDFFSIGTNDLIQYTFAADRMGENVAHLYQPLNPVILNLINNVIQKSHANNIWTAVCGSMGGQTEAIPLLLGMGLDYFSMAASLILENKYLIRKMKLSDCQELAQKCLKLETADQVLKLVNKYLKSINYLA